MIGRTYNAVCRRLNSFGAKFGRNQAPGESLLPGGHRVGRAAAKAPQMARTGICNKVTVGLKTLPDYGISAVKFGLNTGLSVLSAPGKAVNYMAGTTAGTVVLTGLFVLPVLAYTTGAGYFTESLAGKLFGIDNDSPTDHQNAVASLITVGIPVFLIFMTRKALKVGFGLSAKQQVKQVQQEQRVLLGELRAQRKKDVDAKEADADKVPASSKKPTRPRPKAGGAK